mgnify:CR=1 FL=1
MFSTGPRCTTFSASTALHVRSEPRSWPKSRAITTLYFRPQAAGIRRANLVIDSPQLASLAIMQISGAATANAAPTVDVIEFYNASQDHYFISSLQPDIDALDSGRFAGWARTGLTFKAYPKATLGASPVCRFYTPPALGDSHFYSASPVECAQTQAKFPLLVEESSNVMYVGLPDTTSGTCPVGVIPVYRVWDGRSDSNHRYTTDAAIRRTNGGEGVDCGGLWPKPGDHVLAAIRSLISTRDSAAGGYLEGTAWPNLPRFLISHPRSPEARWLAACSRATCAIVIGPTPPGTGVIQLAFSSRRIEIDVAAQLSIGVAVDADVDHDRAAP